jgi:exosortase
MSRLTHFQQEKLWFAGYAVICIAVFWSPLQSLANLALANDAYSHILIVPFVSAVLIWMERKRLFRIPGKSPTPAVILFILGLLLGTLSLWAPHISIAGGWLGLPILGFLCLIWAGFLFFLGAQAFKAGLFPLLFLGLMVPLPGPILDRLIEWLQVGSADVTGWIFHLSGTPFLRQGLIFHLPHVAIEVAKECSGIRSTEALLITCLLAGYLLLRSNWRRAILLAATVPVVIIKNGIRIATLTLLSVHVDPSFLTGRLHHEGGFVFFIIGMLILLPLLWWLQKSEARLLRSREIPGSAPTPSGPLA